VKAVHPEDGGSKVLWNTDSLLQQCMASQHRRTWNESALQFTYSYKSFIFALKTMSFLRLPESCLLQVALLHCVHL